MTTNIVGPSCSPHDLHYRIGPVPVCEAEIVTQRLAHYWLVIISSFPVPWMGESGNWWADKGLFQRTKLPGVARWILIRGIPTVSLRKNLLLSKKGFEYEKWWNEEHLAWKSSVALFLASLKHSPQSPIFKVWHRVRNCNALQHTATHSNTLPHTATHCNALQHTTIHCNILQYTAIHCNTRYCSITLFQKHPCFRQKDHPFWPVRVREKNHPKFYLWITCPNSISYDVHFSSTRYVYLYTWIYTCE